MSRNGGRHSDRPAVSSRPTTLVLVKHAMPILESSEPPRDWRLGLEGEYQSRQLARRLVAYTPLRLVASPEPKALRTGQIVAEVLGLDVSAATGLREFDRPALPVLAKAEHERMNAAIFADPHVPALGAESARDALARFSTAVSTELALTEASSLVAITHGTVIALFVAAHNDIDAFQLWKDLTCASLVELDANSFALREIVAAVV